VRELWGRYWVFAHNGDLKGFAPRLHGAFRPVGATDSERAFCWLMQELAKAHAGVPAIDEMSATLAELLPQVRAHGVFNAMLSNGQALWAHCSTHLHHIVPPAPVQARLAPGRGRQHRLRRAHLAARPGRRGRDRAADEGRDLERVRAGRDPHLRRRRARSLQAVTRSRAAAPGLARRAARERPPSKCRHDPAAATPASTSSTATTS
jgi:hypothetical protein